MPLAFSEIHKNLRKTLIFHGPALLGQMLWIFFRDFSLLGALWATSGRTLATLGRYVSALGSSLAALGGHLAPKGSTRDAWHLTPGCKLSASNSILEP